MKYLFGFIAFIVLVVITSVVNGMALRFFGVYFPAIDVILTAGIVFLLLVVININNEMLLMKQALIKLQSDVDALRKVPGVTRD